MQDRDCVLSKRGGLPAGSATTFTIGGVVPDWEQRDKLQRQLGAAQTGRRKASRDWSRTQRAKPGGKTVRWAPRSQADEGCARRPKWMNRPSLRRHRPLGEHCGQGDKREPPRPLGTAPGTRGTEEACRAADRACHMKPGQQRQRTITTLRRSGPAITDHHGPRPCLLPNGQPACC